MIPFFGNQVPVRLLETHGLTIATYYDPDRKLLRVAKNQAVSGIRTYLLDRSPRWLMGHELAHAYLDLCCSPTARSRLSKFFGDLSEEAYDSSLFWEMGFKLCGYNKERYISPRAALCAEEDFAECCAYLYTGGTSENHPKELQRKLRAIERIVIKKDEAS